MQKWQEDLVKAIKGKMQREGHTQHEVAIKTDTFESQLSDWLSGKKAPSRKNEAKLRRYLDES
jgi:transcriptional regulator with XRE-family HTH domain